MSASKTAGFTIIETMLFLAVSGALVVGVLVASSVGINQQRYRDSVESLKDYLQLQYAAVGTVANPERAANELSCSSDARVSEGESQAQARGRSECLIVGRYIETTNGTRFSSRQVIAYRNPSSTSVSTNAVSELETYVIRTNDQSVETYDLNWDAAIVSPGTEEERPLGILIVRTPESGTIKTFSTLTPGSILSSNLAETLVPASGVQDERIMCVRSSVPVNSPMVGVRLGAQAASQSAVEVLGEAAC